MNMQRIRHDHGKNITCSQLRHGHDNRLSHFSDQKDLFTLPLDVDHTRSINITKNLNMITLHSRAVASGAATF